MFKLNEFLCTCVSIQVPAIRIRLQFERKTNDWCTLCGELIPFLRPLVHSGIADGTFQGEHEAKVLVLEIFKGPSTPAFPD